MARNPLLPPSLTVLAQSLNAPLIQYHIHFPATKNSALKMDTVCLSKTFSTTCVSTRSQNTEHLHGQSRKNVKHSKGRIFLYNLHRSERRFPPPTVSYPHKFCVRCLPDVVLHIFPALKHLATWSNPRRHYFFNIILPSAPRSNKLSLNLNCVKVGTVVVHAHNRTQDLQKISRIYNHLTDVGRHLLHRRFKTNSVYRLIKLTRVIFS